MSPRPIRVLDKKKAATIVAAFFLWCRLIDLHHAVDDYIPPVVPVPVPVVVLPAASLVMAGWPPMALLVPYTV